MASSDCVFLGYQNTAGAGGVYPDPDPPPPGNCVSDDRPILLADGTTVPAADLVPGTILRTRHETTMAWGEWPVLAVSLAEEPVFACELQGDDGPVRSEEHTSELQSLMRISYAVFCLKTKNRNKEAKNIKFEKQMKRATYETHNKYKS